MPQQAHIAQYNIALLLLQYAQGSVNRTVATVVCIGLLHFTRYIFAVPILQYAEYSITVCQVPCTVAAVLQSTVQKKGRRGWEGGGYCCDWKGRGRWNKKLLHFPHT
jgi:hypothetical protein